MNLESLRKHFYEKSGTKEAFPFGPDALVIKVMGKMYALVAIKATPLQVTLKCDPDLALSLRHAFDAVKPAYHMNKKHWNTVILDDSIPLEEIKAMINDSYNLVVGGLKKADRMKLLKSGG